MPALLSFSYFFSIFLTLQLTDQTALQPCRWAVSCKQELHRSKWQTPWFRPPPGSCLLPFRVFSVMSACLNFHSKKEDEKSCGNDCWVCPMLIMRLTHRPFMRLCGGWPLPSSASHPHPRGSYSAWVWLGGKLELFCSGGILGEAVKAATVWPFISPEKRRREKR